MIMLRTVAVSLLMSALLMFRFYTDLVKWVVSHGPLLTMAWENEIYAHVLGVSVASFSIVLLFSVGLSFLVCSLVWPQIEALFHGGVVSLRHVARTRKASA